MNWLDRQLGLAQVMSADGTVREWPTYVCGHCSDVIGLNPLRTRPSVKCQRCGAMICELRPICQTECIPIHSLAPEDPLAARAQLVLDGARTTEEVDRLLVRG